MYVPPASAAGKAYDDGDIYARKSTFESANPLLNAQSEVSLDAVEEEENPDDDGLSILDELFELIQEAKDNGNKSMQAIESGPSDVIVPKAPIAVQPSGWEHLYNTALETIPVTDLEDEIVSEGCVDVHCSITDNDHSSLVRCINSFQEIPSVRSNPESFRNFLDFARGMANEEVRARQRGAEAHELRGAC